MVLQSTHSSLKHAMTYIIKSLTHTMFIILMLIIIIMDTTTKYLLVSGTIVSVSSLPQPFEVSSLIFSFYKWGK